MATMNGGNFRAPLKIFYTDYENIEIGYSCRNTYGGKYEMFALVTRESSPSKAVLAKANQIIKERIPEYDLDTSTDLYWTKQNGWCQYDWKYHKNLEQFKVFGI